METAKNATAQLEKGERKEIEDFLFDNIVIPSDLEAVKDEVEKVRKLHLFAREGLTRCVEDDNPCRRFGHRERKHNLGHVRHNKGLVWTCSRQHIWCDAWVCRVERDGEIAVEGGGRKGRKRRTRWHLHVEG